MKSPYYFIVVFLMALGSLAQSPQSLIGLNDLKFDTDEERSAFSNFSEKDKWSYIELFMTPLLGSNANLRVSAKQRIEQALSVLQKEIADKPEPKKVKIIYQYVHRTFFDKYKLKNSFSDIFSKGEYNCVSGSALYAIIFNLLDIPFQVMEAPRHVFIIAYPKTHRILVESTSPEDGYNAYTESYVDKYVRSLYQSKVISKEEFESTPVKQLFEKYYYSSSGISLKELAGIQYDNFGLYYIDDEQYEKSLQEIKKAYYLISDLRTKYMLRSSLAYIVSNKSYTDDNRLKDLIVLCRFRNQEDAEINNEFIKHEFYRVTQARLIENSNYESYAAAFSQINATLTDTLLKNELAFAYHYELARLGLVNLKPTAYVLEHFEAAYLINPDNANLQSLIIAYLLQKLEKKSQAQSTLKLLDDYGNKFKFVLKNKYYLTVQSNCFLELAYQSFALHDATKAELYLKEFEDLVVENKDIGVEAEAYFVEKAYSEGAAWYYKKGNKLKAKQTLQRGLRYAPESFALMSRLSQLN